MSDYDYDSVTNNLRDSANGTFVTLDNFSPLTVSPIGIYYERLDSPCGLSLLSRVTVHMFV